MIHPHTHPLWYKRLLRFEKKSAVVEYSVAGFLVVAIDYVVFFALFRLLGVGLLEATVIAYIAGLLSSYLLNRYWVFKRDARGQPAGEGAIRYLLLVGFNLVLTYYALLWLQLFGVDPVIGKFVVYTFLYFWVYVTSKYWVFNKKAPL